MKHRHLSFLLALFLAAPVTAFAQDSEQEGEAAPAPDGTEATDTEDQAAADEAPAESGEEEAAPDPSPEPEVSSVESDTGDPAATNDGSDSSDSGTTESDSEEDATAAADAAAVSDATSEGEGGEEEEGDHAGLRYDLETGRWVEDVEPLPWRNTFFYWNNNLRLTTLTPGADYSRSYDPYYMQSFSFRPRWYVGDSASIRVSETLSWELTQPDYYQNSVYMSNLTIGIIDANFYTLPGEIAVGGGFTAILPTNRSSWNCHMVGGLSSSIALTKVFTQIMTGLTIQAFGSFSGTLYTSNACSTESDKYVPAYAVSPSSDPYDRINANNQTLYLTNSPLSGSVGLYAGLAPIPELSFWAQWGSSWVLGYDTTTTDVPVYGGTSGSTTDSVSVTDTSGHTRTYSQLALGVTWLINDWINTTLYYGSSNSFVGALDPSGNVYNPFYTPYSQFTLQFAFVLDRVYEHVRDMTAGDEEEEAATARNEDDEEEEDSDGAEVAALRNNRRAAQ